MQALGSDAGELTLECNRGLPLRGPSAGTPRPISDPLVDVQSRLLARAAPLSEEQMAARHKAAEKEQQDKIAFTRRVAAEEFLQARGRRYVAAVRSGFQFSKHPGIAAEQKTVTEKLMDYLDNVNEYVRAGVGIWAHGPAGSGKDHLLISLACKIIAKTGGYTLKQVGDPELTDVEGVRIQYVRGSDLFASLRRAMSGGREEEIVASYSRPDILILSDPLPPLGDLTAFQSQMLLDIVDRRNVNMKPTWTTINVADQVEADRRLGAPIVDRLMQDALVLTCNWPSYRTERAG